MSSWRVAVVGSGQMGPDIGLSFALAGAQATVVCRRPDAVAEVEQRVAANLGVLEAEGLVDDASAVAARVTARVGLDTVADVDYVCEAIAEDLDAKRKLLAAVEDRVTPDALLASTTSALSATQLQQQLRTPERFVITHYAQPAHLMPLCEVVPGARTASETVDRACESLQRCGIRPVVCRDVPGFLFSRLQATVLREAVALVRDDIASVEDIEAVLKLGYATRLPVMGPFEHADLGGLDLLQTIANTIWPDLDCARDATSGPLADHVAAGRLGMRTGEGFHRWTTESAAAFRARRDREVIRRVKQLRAEPQQ